MNLTRVEGTAGHRLQTGRVEKVATGLKHGLLLVVVAQTAPLLQSPNTLYEHFLTTHLHLTARTADSLVTDTETVVAGGLLALRTAVERISQGTADMAVTARFEELMVDKEVLQEGVAATAVEWVLCAAGSAHPADSALIRLEAVDVERDWLLPTVLTEKNCLGRGSTAE